MKMLAVALITLPLLALALVNPSAAPASAAAPQDFDAAAVYKAKCAMCHGQKAEKKFDSAKADEPLVETVLKGKDDVTPKMPGYEAKGMTADQAKALVTQMKSLKQ
jgi:mono/diheme cytochrome c family protein